MDQLCEEGVKTRAKAMINDRWVFLAPQVVLGVMKLALLLDHVEKTPDGTDALRNVIYAELGLAQFLTNPDSDSEPGWGSLPGGLSLELIANQYFNSSTPTGSAIARYQLLWREIPPSLDRPRADGLEEAFLQATGTTMEACHRVGMALMAHVIAHREANLQPNYFDSLNLTEVELSAVDLFVGDSDRVRTLLSEEVEQFGFNWAANTFRRFPIVRHRDGSLTIISSAFLRDRACESAFYWELDQHLGRGTKPWGDFKRFRGLVVEDYVRRSLEAMYPRLPGGAKRLWGEAELKQMWPGAKVCDFVLDTGSAWVCIEVVSHLLSAGTSTATSVDAVNGDVRMMVEEKAVQLHSTISRLLSGDGRLSALSRSGPMMARPLIVATGGFPVNPITMTVIHERLAARNLLSDTRIGPLEIIDLDNLEAIEALAESGGPTLPQVLEDKASAGLRLASMDQYLALERHLALQRPSRLKRPLDEAQEDVLAWVRDRLRSDWPPPNNPGLGGPL